MFNSNVDRFKSFTIIISIIIIFTSIILVQSLISLDQNSNKIIKESIALSYKEKEKELKNYVTLAYKTIESYHARTSKDKIKDEVKFHIEEQTEYLFSIINNEYEKNKNILSEDELKKRIISIVNSVRYSKSGYFWINDFKHNMIMHPIKKELEDVPFVKLGIDELNKTSEDKGFIEYSFYNPNSKEIVFKSSIVKVFKPYNWIIGTGSYIDDVSEEIKKEALKAISQMKYGKTGYFWIIDSNHKLLMDGLKQTFPNEDKSEVKNSDGVYLYREIVKTAHNSVNGDFVRYFWTIPDREGEFEKLFFVKKFEQWDFIIGAGTYIFEIEKNSALINKEADDNSSYALRIVVLFIMMMYLIINLMMSIKKRKRTEEELINTTIELDTLNKNLEEKVTNRTIEIEGQKVVLQGILDSQKSMLVVTNFSKVSFMNDSFKKFFNSNNQEEFEKRFESLIDVFCEYKDYIHKGRLNNTSSQDSIGRRFYDLVISAKDEKQIVVILDSKLEARSFHIDITMIDKEKDLFLVSLTDITKITVEKIMAEQKAYIDELTGVPNKNKFNKVFKKELSRANRYKTGFSIALLDIDHFKSFNDTYGHLIGDEVLVMLSNECQENIRIVDFFARWGGEEFALLFPETKKIDAIASANYIRKNIENLEHKTAGKITCSLGVTEYIEGDTLKSLFKRCDEALYLAKRNGRNRVESI